MTLNPSTLIRRVLVLVVVLGALFAATHTTEAKALNPERTSVTTTVNIVYWDLVRFWIPSKNPGVGYYNYLSNGSIVDYNVYCNGSVTYTGNMHGSEGFQWCGNIYLDFRQQVGNISTFRDGSVAFWLAHEFGHHIQELLAIRLNAPYHELEADCFAGLYFRHGVYKSKRLVYGDYTEARRQIWALGAGDTDHGTNSQRLRAFDFGFRQVNYQACMNGAGVSY